MSNTPELIPLRCPTCATEFDVGHLAPSSRTFCPKCRTIVTVPGPAPASVAPAPPAPAPSPEPAAVAPPAPAVTAPPPPPPRTAEPPARPAFRPPTKRAPVEPRPGRALAVAALVVGILSFVVPAAGVVAIILGVLALRKGKGLAGGAIVCGSLSLVLHVALYFVLVLPWRERETCHSRVVQIRGALKAYRQATGQDAPSLLDLVRAKHLEASSIDCPSRKGMGMIAYRLMPPDVARDSGVLLAERDDYHGAYGRRVLTVGGTIEFRPGAALAALPGMEPPRTASGPPPRVEKRVALTVNAKGWTGAAFDIKEALRRGLAEQGIQTGDDAKDGVVDVDYEERRGPLYTNGAHSTIVEMGLTVRSPDRSQKLLVLQVRGVAPSILRGDAAVTPDALHRSALEEFRKSPGFAHAGELMGASLGVPSSLAKLVEPLLRRETREIAMELLERNKYKAADGRGAAAMAAAREDYDDFGKLGKDAVDVLVLAFREYADFDRAAMARVLGEAGESRGAAPLVEFLRSGGGSDPKTLVAVIEALGRIGDESALPAIEGLAGTGGPELAVAAQAAAKSIHGRQR